MTDFQDSIPVVIYLARKRAKLTQKQLAKALGIDNGQVTVSRWEMGTRPVPRDKLKPLAELLKIPLEKLLP